MKKTFLFLAIFTNVLLFGQKEPVSKKEIVVPIEVKQAFEKEFSNQTPSWQMEYRGDDADQMIYETQVFFEKRDAVVFYDKLGNLTAVEVEIHNRELPTGALNYIEKNYPNRSIYKAVKIYKNNKATISFEVGIRDNDKLADLVFDSTGYFLTRVEKTN